MPNIDDLLREKRRLGLTEEVSCEEKKKLMQGYPIQKIIGFINFDDLKIKVNRNVLIPRYETFELVELALKYIDKNSKVLDLCCGSGYIGLTIKQKTDCIVVLSDIDDEAIVQTRENSEINNLDVEIIKSNLFDNIEETFDVIVSNPPYIPRDTRLPKDVVDYEPLHALYGGDDGNFFYKKIVLESKKYIKKGGYLIFEISEDNKMFLMAMGFAIIKDINGKNRIAIKRY